MKPLAILAAVLSVSCSTPQVTPPYAAAPPEVDRRFADLSRQDMLEIAALPDGHPEIRKPVFWIHMVDPGWAEVESGPRPKKAGDKFTRFSVHKERGRWIIVKGSVHDDWMVLVTGLTNRWSQPLAVVMSTFDFMKQLSMFATLAPASGGSAQSR